MKTKPQVEALEPRQLLTTIATYYPSSYVGPVNQTSMILYGNPTAPTIGLSGMPDHSIGGPAGIYASSSGVMSHFKSLKVEYGDAVKSQRWDASEGSYIADTGTTKNFDTTQLVQFTTHNWFWDENPGQRIITVSYEMTDGSSGAVSLQVNVQAPTIDYYRVSGNENQFQWKGEGFSNLLGWSYYFEYSAKIDSVPTTGEFSFIQMVHPNGIWYKEESIVSYTPEPQWAIDVGRDNLNGKPNTRGMSFPMTTTEHDKFIGGRSVFDHPKFMSAFNENATIRFRSKNSFLGHLIWKPQGGIHVSVAWVHHVRIGDATYHGHPNSSLDYADLDNWEITENSHPNPLITTGTKSRSIPTWNVRGYDLIDQSTITTPR